MLCRTEKMDSLALSSIFPPFCKRSWGEWRLLKGSRGRMGDLWLFCIFMVCDKTALPPESEAGGRYILDFQSMSDWD